MFELVTKSHIWAMHGRPSPCHHRGFHPLVGWLACRPSGHGTGRRCRESDPHTRMTAFVACSSACMHARTHPHAQAQVFDPFARAYKCAHSRSLAQHARDSFSTQLLLHSFVDCCALGQSTCIHPFHLFSLENRYSGFFPTK